MTGPVVETERLRLRPFRLDDIDAYTAIRAKPEVARWLRGGEAAAAEARAIAEELVPIFTRAWDDGYGPWAVEERATGRLIGHCGLRYLTEFGETEVLYTFDSAAWGHGYAGEGARASRDYGFDVLGLPKLMAITLPDNVRSRRVMESIGMTYRRMTQLHGYELVYYAMERPPADG